MWLFLNNGFFSIVAPKKDEPSLSKREGPQTRAFVLTDYLVVRARRKGDIERAFRVDPKHVVETPARDYRYRACILKATVAEMVAIEVRHVGYTNFKSSIKDNDYHDACSRVWGVMDDYQRRMASMRPIVAADYQRRGRR